VLKTPDFTERQNALLRQALQIRKTEERLLKLFGDGKLNGTVHTCIGQELNAVVVADKLQSIDYVFSNHRGHGHYLARTKDFFGLIAELMGSTAGTSGGYGGSQHLFNDNFYSNGIQGGMTPIAAGLAFAAKLKGERSVVVAYIGDGTLGEGVIYEAFNLASVWNAPVLFILENNGIAQSTSFKQTFAGSVQTRVEGFGLKYFFAEGHRIDELDAVAATAIDFVRGAQKPALFEIQSTRLKSHSKGDDNRSDEELSKLWERDCVAAFLGTAEAAAALEEIEERLDQIVADIERTEPLTRVSNARGVSSKAVTSEMQEEGQSVKVNDLIYQALAEALESHDVILMGEDIEFKTPFTPKGYGGAFKVTKDLSERYPGRVRNTPISEAAIVGFGTGLALGGFRPVVEIMFGDFATLILDQLLQHAAKFRQMSNNRLQVPLVVRTPMGGRRGYGPTHSQSLEKHFLGIAGLRVVILNRRLDPRVLYRSIFDLQDPVLVIENKVLYTKSLNTLSPVGFNILLTNEPFPTVIVRPVGKIAQVTILCYGEMLDEAEVAIQTAFMEEEIIAEIVCFSTLYPVNAFPLLDSLRKTNTLLTLEEGSTFAGFSSEIIAFAIEQGVSIKKLMRLGNETIIPCSFPAERNLLPSADSIVQAIKTIYSRP